MGQSCPDGMTTDELDDRRTSWKHAFNYVSNFESVVPLVCAGIFFGCYYKLTKPVFIKVFWILTVVGNLALMIASILA